MKAMIYPPGPKSKTPFGVLQAFRRDVIGFLKQAADQYGDIAYFKAGPQKIFLLHDLDFLQEVLVTHNRNFTKSRGLQLAKRILGEGLLTSEGEKHLRQRRLVQPAFHRQRLEAYGSVMTDYAARLSGRWKDGGTIDAAHEMMQLTLAIVGKTLFDADVEAEADEIGEALTIAMALFIERLTMPMAALYDLLPLPSNFRFLKAKKRLDGTIYRMIEKRRASGEDRGDFLSMLLRAQDVEGDGGSMTDLQVRDEAMTLFLAGHETTAVALAWTWYLLSQHPAAESKFHDELDHVLGGKLPTVEDLPKLTFTRKVLAESMRLFPPAYVFGRKAIQDFPIGKYVVPAGATILISPYVLHHDTRYFSEPDQFDPERWTPEAERQRPKFSYLPFGAGPRVCIGESFAWMEGILVLATLGQQWRMCLVPGHPIALQPMITLRPKHGIKMTLHRRS
ncbi:MAG: cytochrome P450 [candidate division KSB1 bacterium]|nr:cytochrome P450 [candidate division KSB1 bacterium]MDZ7366043.1 cytochrome P450 [candidate division KSB1 bacterium]MDZ7404160.1 cytochrome P450 [candidate division KSB1 bacterium]